MSILPCWEMQKWVGSLQSSLVLLPYPEYALAVMIVVFPMSFWMGLDPIINLFSLGEAGALVMQMEMGLPPSTRSLHP